MPADTSETWLPVTEAYRAVRAGLPRGYFRTEAAFRHHLRKRDSNGLTAADAVRLSPLGRLIVNPHRVVDWATSERSDKAA
jgi:hypothetical protein